MAYHEVTVPCYWVSVLYDRRQSNGFATEAVRIQANLLR